MTISRMNLKVKGQAHHLGKNETFLHFDGSRHDMRDMTQW